MFCRAVILSYKNYRIRGPRARKVHISSKMCASSPRQRKENCSEQNLVERKRAWGRGIHGGIRDGEESPRDRGANRNAQKNHRKANDAVASRPHISRTCAAPVVETYHRIWNPASAAITPFRPDQWKSLVIPKHFLSLIPPFALVRAALSLPSSLLVALFFPHFPRLPLRASLSVRTALRIPISYRSFHL